MSTIQAEILDILQSIERRCDVNALRYRGVLYWPLCRHRLWVELLKQRLSASDLGGLSNNLPSWPDVGRINAELAGPPALGLLRTHEKGSADPIADSSFKPRALFFLRPEEYADKVSGAAFAKMLDSVAERASLQGAATKLELADPRTMGFARLHPSLFIHLEQAGRDVAFDPPGTLENFETLASTLAALNISVALDPAALLAEIGKIFYFARIFEKILRMTSPRVFFLSVYYHPVGMAWMLACRWAGVKSIDLQHGRLGPHEGRYTQLTAAPPEGYELMPDAVWCWGAKTKHDIDVDKNPRCERHGGLIGGNPWLHKWRYGDITGLESPEAKDFAARTTDRPKILVSLQPLERPIGPAVLDAMRRSPPEWLWLIRVHPLRRHTAPDIARFLKDFGITNAEMDLATSLPLFSLLRHAVHHVTVSSSVAVEAAAFDVRTSLVSDMGDLIFADQVRRGICRYTPTADTLLAHIGDFLAGPPTPLRDDFIDMGRGAVDRVLSEILA